MNRVLIVADDLLIINYYRQGLHPDGITVEHSARREDVLQLAREERPMAIIVDVVLEKLDGPTIVAELRALPGLDEVPIFLLPNNLAKLTRLATRAGATRVLPQDGKAVEEVRRSIGLRAETSITGTDSEWLTMLLDVVPEVVANMRRCLHSVARDPADSAALRELFLHVHTMSERAALIGLRAVHRFTTTLENLLFELLDMPEQINPSVLRTMGQAIDFTATLLERGNPSRITDPHGGRVLVIDDEEIARETVTASMNLVGLQVVPAADSASALSLLSQAKYEVIFLDVGLPGTTGFELCIQIRTLPLHELTPIVFLTGMTTFQNRVQSSLSGGNDFVGKPFNVLELALKALMWIFRAQLGTLGTEKGNA